MDHKFGPKVSKILAGLPPEMAHIGLELVRAGHEDALDRPDTLAVTLETGADHGAIASAVGQIRGVVAVYPAVTEQTMDDCYTKAELLCAQLTGRLLHTERVELVVNSLMGERRG